MATITFDHIVKNYGDVSVVKDMNIEIGDGEFMVLVGPSGCGKTTALRMVAGLEEITAGTLKIGDRVVNDVAPKDRDIAMVFQSYALYPHMTVYDNLAFGLKLRKVSKAEIERRVKEAAETIQLQNLLQRKPKELSGGQRQRVAIARAFLKDAPILVLDEATSHLDTLSEEQVRTALNDLMVDRTTIVIAHRLSTIRAADLILVLDAGRVIESGTHAELLARRGFYTRLVERQMTRVQWENASLAT
jgi:multiple sugar transport system ATP-binding protein